MYRTPGALSGAWADPIPAVSVPSEPQPQPHHRPTLSVAQSHAHAFNTPKGWEAPERPRASRELSPPKPAAIDGNSGDKPKWILPYQRYDNQELPYTAWEAVGSPTSSVGGASRSPIPPSSSRSSVDRPRRTPRRGGSEVSRALSEPGARSFSVSSSYRTAKTHQTAWKWGNEVIPDPDFPDGPPPCLSPRLSPVVSFTPRSVQMNRGREAKSVGDAWEAGIRHGKDNSVDVAAGEYFDLPVELNPTSERLTVSEVGVFGRVGTVETVWGEKQPECGLCRCEELRLRYRIHGETCPLHIKAKKWGPASLLGEGEA